MKRVPARRGSRVLFVTQTAHVWGGVERWLDITAAGLREGGWDVTVGLVRGRRFHDPALYRARHHHPVTVEIDGRGGTWESRVRQLLNAIHRTEPDIVVPVNIADAIDATSRARRSRDIRLLYPLHGLLGSYLADIALYREQLDLVVTTNRLAEKAVGTLSGIAAERLVYAPYGCASPLEPPGLVEPATPFRVAFVGRLTEEQKRSSDAVRVVRELHRRKVPVICEIVGEGDAEPGMRKDLADLERDGFVRFLGYLSEEELYRRVYPGLAALLICSSWETGPIVAWEAMRHGAVVVTTRYAGLEAEGALQDGVTALVSDVGDWAGLSQSIQRLVSDASLFRELRAAGCQVAGSRYSIEESQRSWGAAFDRCVALPALAARIDAPPLPSGKLEAVLGAGLGTMARRLLHRRVDALDPGGEWPHSRSHGGDRAEEMGRALAGLEG